jgi:DNA-binding MarR family transcriptional regulator
MPSRGKHFRDNLDEQIGRMRETTERLHPERAADALPLAGRIGALAGLHRTFTERTFAGAAITHSEFQVLWLLRTTSPCSPTDLARHVQQTSAGMTRTLDRLERAGLVERRAHASDRRRVEVVVTRAGERVADDMQAVELAAFEEVLGDLDASERKALAARLDQLIERLYDAMP